jgi:hypothetical protein
VNVLGLSVPVYRIQNILVALSWSLTAAETQDSILSVLVPELQICASTFLRQSQFLGDQVHHPLKYWNIKSPAILSVVLYWCETSWIVSSRERRLAVFEIKPLRRIWGHMKFEVTERWEKLYNELFRYVCDLQLLFLFWLIQGVCAVSGKVARNSYKTCLKTWRKQLFRDTELYIK